MKLGFNLLLWTGSVTEEHFPLLEKLKKVGYDGVEIPIFGGDKKQYKALGQALKDNGLQATAVTVIPDEEHSPISKSAKNRKGAIKHLKTVIDLGHEIGVQTLLGPYHSPLGVFSGQGPTEAEKDRAAEVHRVIAQYAQDAGTVCAIEYLNRFECYFLTTMADAAAYVKRVGHKNFGTMYDTFHANIEEKDPVGIIGQNAKVIRHVHISENDRGTPGKGHVAFKPVIQALKDAKYDQWLVIEAFGRALPALAAATRVWRDFFSSPEEVYTDGYKYLRKLVGKNGKK